MIRRFLHLIDRLLLQWRIISALADRDFQLRTNRGIFGFLSVLVEPLVLIAVLLALKIIIRTRITDAMNVVIWMACGVTIYFLFFSVAIAALNGVKKGQGLFYFRRVRPIDTLLAKGLLEGQVYATVQLLICLAVFAWEWRISIDDFGLTVMVFLLTILLALGIGGSALVIGPRVPVVKFLVSALIRRVLLWTSGVFFSLSSLPEFVHPFLTWNPVLHAVELFRYSFSRTYPIPSISLTYLATCAFVSCGIGLIIYSNNEALLLRED